MVDFKALERLVQLLEGRSVGNFTKIFDWEDPGRFFAAAGASEAMLEAKKTGKARFVGFTGHKDRASAHA
jgi:hypothetical protein